MSTQGTGTIAIPAEVNGAPVTTIAPEAFKECTATSITIPETVTSIKRAAFSASKITSITLPAALEAVPNNCFQNCSNLEEVVFEGTTIQSIGAYAFRDCVSLKELTVPALTSSTGYTETDSGSYISNTHALGAECFAGCSSVTKLTFLGDSSVKAGLANKFAGVSCISGMDSLETVVYFCKKESIGAGSSASVNNALAKSTAYHTINFFNSEQDVVNGEKLGSVTYLSGTSIVSILTGTASKELAYSDGSGTDYATLPALEDGRVWGISYEWNNDYNDYVHTYTVNSDLVGLADSFNAIAVDRGNLDYGWITMPEIYGNEVTPTIYDSRTFKLDSYTFYRSLNGTVPALDHLKVLAADGSELVEGKDYTLEWETARRPYSTEVWTTTTREQANQVGCYRVRARGVGDNANTVTYDVVFLVADYTPDVVELDNGAASIDANAAVIQAGAGAYGANAKDVLVNAGNWQAQLVAAGLAGVGGGAVIYDPGPGGSSAQVAKAVQAFNATGATGLMILGSESEVALSRNRDGGSAADNISLAKDISPSRCSAATAQELAESVYKLIRDNGVTAWGNTWGTDAGGKVAIVASSTRGLDALPIVQCAYQLQAPVFFTGGDGTLSTTTLGYLSDFDTIIVAGDEAYVSSDVVAAIQAKTGVTPRRLLASGGDACENSAQLTEELGGVTSSVVVASAASPATVTAAALMATVAGGAFYTCSSTSDAKYLQSLITGLAKQDPTSVEKVYLVGDFSSVAPGIAERIKSVWGTAQSSEVTTADTQEVNGMLYSFSGSAATLVKVLEPACTAVTLGEKVAYGGSEYTVTGLAANALAGTSVTSLTVGSAVTGLGGVSLAGASQLTRFSVQSPSVTSIPASYFKGLAKLTSVSFAGTVKSVGANAFYGCKALTAAPLASTTSVGASAFQGCTSLKSASLKTATSIGASAFQGCTALASLTLGSKLKTIGASAFQGCTKLTKLSATSGKLTTVGKQAFYGCAALKSATVAASSSIGASAFQGCTKLTSVTLSSAKLKSIGKKAFYGCKKLKTITIKSTKLKQAKVGASAFKGTVAKAKVKVPKAKLKVYKKLLVKKGLSKKATFKKC